MVFVRETPRKMLDLGGTPSLGNLHFERIHNLDVFNRCFRRISVGFLESCETKKYQRVEFLDKHAGEF